VTTHLSCHRRVAALTATLALFVLAPAAHAAMSATLSAVDTVVVSGDDGPNRLRVVDGRDDGADGTYGVQLIDENGGTVTGDPSYCVSDAGSTYCGGNAIRQVQVSLAGGDDEVIGGGVSFHQLTSLVADLGAGNDRTSGEWIGLPVTFNGGDGDDRLYGDVSNDTLNGGPGADQMLGATGNDTLHGDTGDDQVNGGGGDDKVYGDAGNDSVVGSDESDTVDGGPGLDAVDGDGGTVTEGNDIINVDDGERDTVSCGPGGDVVTADQLDVIGSGECESVTRSGVAGSPGAGGGGASGASNAFVVGHVTSSKKTGSVTIALQLPGPGTLSFLGTAKVAAGLTARQKKITVVKRHAGAKGAGVLRVTLKPTAVLRRKGKLKASLVIGYKPTGGAQAKQKGAVTFRLRHKR
jgi:Ca2+-binding RTX toxin-like protein